MKRILVVIALLACAGCSSDNDNAHTTATTVVPPPPQQVLRAETRPGPQTLPVWGDHRHGIYDPAKPLFVVNLPNDKTLREGEALVIDFSLENAKLRGEGGEYRIRYMVDDDDMQWIDRWEQLVLTGWIAGKHTIRFELIGPDGWPYRNGDYNIATREITVVK